MTQSQSISQPFGEIGRTKLVKNKIVDKINFVVFEEASKTNIYMKRVMIIGSCGAGKSTLAHKLHEITGLALIHLDQYHWLPNWVEPPKEEWKSTVGELAKKESWIMDGNFGRTIDIRLERADTVIYLNHPTWLCLWRVLKRVKKYNGKSRPDMTEGCPERLDFSFLWYVLMFKHRTGRSTLRKIQQYRAGRTVWILNNDKDVNNFLKNLRQGSSLFSDNLNPPNPL